MSKRFDTTSIIGMVIALLTSLIGLYTQLTNPETGLFLFGLLLFSILLYFLISWPTIYFKKKFTLVNSNKQTIINTNKDLNKLKDNLDIHKRLIRLELKDEIKNQK